MIDQVPFRDLTTPVGIVLAGTLIRQLIEIAKKSFLPWLDAGNERKGVAILAIVLYGAWLAAYGRDLTTDGWQALFAALAVGATAIGANETIDAARDQVAKNVVSAIRDRPSLAGSSASTEGSSMIRSGEAVAPIEAGPDIDIRVAGGDAFDEPLDPAYAGSR